MFVLSELYCINFLDMNKYYYYYYYYYRYYYYIGNTLF